MPRVLVNLAQSETIFTFSSGEKINLKIGYETLIHTYFKHDLPTPYQTELAIIAIENAIEGIYFEWKSVDKIMTDNEQVHLMIDYFKAEKQIDSAQLEQLFNRVADFISGSPKQELAFFTSPNFMAILFILREVIHHLSIDTIEII